MAQLFPYSFTSLRALGFTTSQLSTTEIDTLDTPAGAKGALIQTTGGNANWRDDGVAPTAVVGGGMSMIADAEPQWYSLSDLSRLQFIAVGTPGHLLVSFYG